MKSYTYLAIGDSYTIGESVVLYKSFPYQTVQLLRQQGFTVTAPEIIAKTGWTTSELMQAMNGIHYLSHYDILTILIGVNNQYRGLPSTQYEMELTQMLIKAIELTRGKSNRVFILSIPDYGKTPFGQNMDHKKIETEIDEFNRIGEKLADQYRAHYIEITNEGREVKTNPELIAADGLHPSEKEYARWAGKLVKEIRKNIIV